LIRDNRPASAYPFEPLEVASLVSVALIDAYAIWLGSKSTIEIVELDALSVRSKQPVTIGDFVNDVPAYWPWLAAALGDRYSNAVLVGSGAGRCAAQLGARRGERPRAER
jgi:hypothetical protein